MKNKWKTLIGLEVQYPKEKIILSGKDLFCFEVSKAKMSIEL